ncbi:hypothetical protein TL16_g08236 [Triparma laevis f. inornata]|uniref:Uncharacterized protein n=1 Tax=Triparma laevis f. inornata TaxID=1714386 RepID=A0A9W7EJY8_9STRA|nr:hypothetical protein TL16_g08236 [Triparma laevis f. inornata]
MKFTLLASLLASAAAFHVAPTVKPHSSLSVNELELGNTAPLGVYDPLGWLDNEPEAFERRRAVERKVRNSFASIRAPHQIRFIPYSNTNTVLAALALPQHGRIAMAAVVGTIVHNNDIEFDGYLSPSNNLKFSDIPNGVDGIRAIPTQGLLQILFFFALVELGKRTLRVRLTNK